MSPWHASTVRAHIIRILAHDHACLGHGSRVDGQMRHYAHIVQLTDLALLLDQQNLIVDLLLVRLSLCQLGSQLLTLVNDLLSQLLLQELFQASVLGSNEVGRVPWSLPV